MGWTVGTGPRGNAVSALPATGPDPTKWSLIWDEQFTGTTLDTTKWSATENSSSNNNAYWRAANVSVNNTLQIRSYNAAYGGKAYQSGNVQTYAPYKWATPTQYFRAEQRSRNPVYMGFWPAPLWFRRVPMPGGGASNDGEIDLYEGYGSQAPGGAHPPFRSSITLHDAYANNRHDTKEVNFSTLANPDPYDWHTWVIEKIPGRIDTWIDGVPNASWVAAELSWWNTIFETAGQGWAARSTMQIQMMPTTSSHWSGTPDGSTVWTHPASTMEVDYMTFWDYLG